MISAAPVQEKNIAVKGKINLKRVQVWTKEIKPIYNIQYPQSWPKIQECKIAWNHRISFNVPSQSGRYHA